MTKIETSSNLQPSYASTEQYDTAKENLLQSRLRNQIQTIAMFESGIDLPSDTASSERLLPSPQSITDTALALHSLEMQRESTKGTLGYLRLYIDSARYTRTPQTRDLALKTLANSTLSETDYTYYKAEIDQLDETKQLSRKNTLFAEIDDLIDYTEAHNTDSEPFLRQASTGDDDKSNPLSGRAVDFYLQTKADLAMRTREAKTSAEDTELHGIYSSLNLDLEAFKKLDTSSQAVLLVAGKEITKDIAAIGATLAPEQVEEVIGSPLVHTEDIDTERHAPTPGEVILIAEAEYLVTGKIAEAAGVVSDETAPPQQKINDEINRIGDIVDIVLENIPSRDNPNLTEIVRAIKKARKTHTDPRIAAEALADYSVQHAA